MNGKWNSGARSTSRRRNGGPRIWGKHDGGYRLRLNPPRLLVFHIMGALAEFEPALIQERTRAGLDAARRRGVKLGRRRKLSISQVDHARTQIDAGAQSVASMARLLGVGAETLRRALKA